MNAIVSSLKCLSLSLLLLWSLGACDNSETQSELNEGFVVTEGRGLDDLTKQIQEQFAIQGIHYDQLRAVVKTMVLASFQIRGAEYWVGPPTLASGAFIDNQGHFVTASHALFGANGWLTIRTYDFNAKGIIVAQDLRVWVESIKSHSSPSRLYDIAVGKVAQYTPKAFLEPSDRSVAKSDPIISSGFPIPTNRIQSANRNTARRYMEQIETQVQAEIDGFRKSRNPELHNHSKYSELALEYLRQRGDAKDHLGKVSYDLVTTESGISFSFGKALSSSAGEQRFLVDSDGGLGSSGAPMVNLATGKLVGIFLETLGGTDTPQILRTHPTNVLSQEYFAGVVFAYPVTSGYVARLQSDAFESQHMREQIEARYAKEQIFDSMGFDVRADGTYDPLDLDKEIPEAKNCENALETYFSYAHLARSLSGLVSEDKVRDINKFYSFRTRLAKQTKKFIGTCYQVVDREMVKKFLPQITLRYKNKDGIRYERLINFYKTYPTMVLPLLNAEPGMADYSISWIEAERQDLVDVVAYHVAETRRLDIAPFAPWLNEIDTKEEKACVLKFAAKTWNDAMIAACVKK